MKRAFGPYRRLARGLFGASSLWLGPNDLLYVHGTGVFVPFFEHYQRFELARVQSAAVAKTRTGLVLNIAYGLTALVLGALAVTGLAQAAQEVGPSADILYFLAVPCAVVAVTALALLIANIALGPTCHFQLQTPTRVERVRAIRRLRTARRVLRELLPVIAAAQLIGPPEFVSPPPMVPAAGNVPVTP